MLLMALNLPTPPATGRFVRKVGILTDLSSLTRRMSVVDLSNLTVKSYTEDEDDSFILGVTKPTLADPWNPTATDNVGWDGTTLDVISGDYTIPANTTVTNKRFTGYVTFTDATSVAVNCLFEGRPPGGSFSSGLIKGANGGTLDRCTVIGTLGSITYYRNGITMTGNGVWTLTRCAVMRAVDGPHVSATAGAVKAYGCLFGPTVFMDTDLDHANDSQVPFWTHNDAALQRLNGPTLCGDEFVGCYVRAFFDTTDVTYDPVSSLYVNGPGSFGNPAAAMNGSKKRADGSYIGPGSTTRYTKGEYSNSISYTDRGPYQGVVVRWNWFDGSHYVNGLLFNAPPSGAHSATFEGNRFAMGGRKWNGYWTFGRWPAGTVISASGNVLDDDPSVPVSRWGEPIVVDSTGARVAP